MKALVVILVLVAIGVGAWFLLFSGPDFGIAPGHPLGSWDKLAAYTSEHELEHGGATDAGLVVTLFRELDNEIGEREGLKAESFLDRVPGYPHLVVVVRDANGKVVAVGGQFRSGLFEFSSQGSRSNVMLAKLWLAVVGEEPKFEKKMFGANAGQDFLEAVATGKGFRGVWRKEGPDGLQIAHQTVDKVAFLAE